MSSPAPARGGLGAYLLTATLARMTSESIGPSLLIVAIAVLGSASTGSFLAASITAASAVAGPVIGAVFDRTPHPKRAFAAAMASVGIGTALVALAIGHVPVPVLIVLVVLAGLGAPALTGAWTAQIPGLVTPARLHHAYSADAGTYSVASVVGPPIAASLVVISGVAPLWMPIATIAAALIALRWVPLRPRHAHGDEHSGAHSDDHQPDLPQPPAGLNVATLVSDLRRGFGAMLGIAPLRRNVVMTTIVIAGQAALYVAAPLIALERTGSLGFTGVILGAYAVGDVAGAALILRWPIHRPDRVVFTTTFVSGLAIAGVGIAQNLPLILTATALAGAVNAPLISAMFQVRNREAPKPVVTQVFTTGASLRMTMYAAATAVYGVVLHAGVGWVIAIGVAMHVVAIAAGLLSGSPVRGRAQLRG